MQEAFDDYKKSLYIKFYCDLKNTPRRRKNSHRNIRMPKLSGYKFYKVRRRTLIRQKE